MKMKFSSILLFSVTLSVPLISAAQNSPKGVINRYNQPATPSTFISQIEVENVLKNTGRSTAEDAVAYADAILRHPDFRGMAEFHLTKTNPWSKDHLIIYFADRVVSEGRFKQTINIHPKKSSILKSYHPKAGVFYMPNPSEFFRLTPEEQKEFYSDLAIYVEGTKDKYLTQMSELHKRHIELAQINPEMALKTFGFEINSEISLDDYQKLYNENQSSISRAKAKNKKQEKLKAAASYYIYTTMWMNLAPVIDLKNTELAFETAQKIRQAQTPIQYKVQPSYLGSLYVLTLHLFTTYQTISMGGAQDLPGYREMMNQ